jgi:plasmid maintenance system antidote protein VapI
MERSGLTVYRIAQATGISAVHLGRFLRGGVSIQLDTADKLAACLGLRLVLPHNAKPLGPTLTDAMKVAIQRSGLRAHRIAKEAGIHQSKLGRFILGVASVRLNAAERLAAYLGLQLAPDPDGVCLGPQLTPDPDTMTPQPILTDAIKAAIERSGLTVYRIAQASGLVAQNLRRFLRGGVSIRLDNADKLADCLGLRLLLTPDENPLGPTLTEAMKVAIQRNGLPVYRIAWATGISAVHLSRFLRDEESIRLDTADRLAAYLGLQLVPDPDAKPPEPTPANLARPTLAKTKTRAKAKRKAN